MARKQDAARLVDEGEYNTDGMYRRGGPTAKYDPDELERQARELVGDFNMPALERVKDIRDWLTEVIAPHIDGPHDGQSLLCGEFGNTGGGWFEHLTLTTGSGCFHINADRHTWVEDCVDALRENKQLEQLLNGGGDLDSTVRLAVRQGQSIQRIQDRAIFAPFVLSESRRREKVSTRRRDSAALNAMQWLDVQTFICKRIKAGDSAIGACNQASAHLKAGTLPDLTGVKIKIGGKRLANLYSQRNKPK